MPPCAEVQRVAPARTGAYTAPFPLIRPSGAGVATVRGAVA